MTAMFSFPDLDGLAARSLRPVRLVALPLAASALLCACVYLPKAGPLRSEIASEAEQALKPFALIQVSPNTLTALGAKPREPGFSTVFGDAPVKEPTLGIGDAVSLVIFEVGSEPLFSNAAAAGPNGSRGVSLPERTIEFDGSIDIPFAGRVPAAGRTPRELQTAIQRALSGRAAQPQVVLSTTRSIDSAVTVLGETGAGARVPLSARGERLLDVLAASGGLRGSVFDTRVELSRDGKAAHQPLSRVLRDPKENLRLRPGDTVLVTRQPETFTVFGATGRSAQIEFGAEQLSLAEAMAKSGGLQDARADPRGIFLFRYEPLPVAEQLGVQKLATGPSGAPVVYQFDFQRATSYFLAQQFAVRDHDVLYVANAPVNELEKFLQLVGLLTQPALSGFAVGNSIR